MQVTTETDRSQLSVTTFGAPRIELGGAPLQPKTRGATSLLLFLAVERTRHQRRWLAEFLWEETSFDSARLLLRNALYNLRKTCGSEHFQADRETICIHPASTIRVDAAEFQSITNTAPALHSVDRNPGRTGATDEADRLLRAIELYDAHFLSGFTLPGSNSFNSWIVGKRWELKAALDSTATRLVSLLRSAGDLTTAIRIAEKWLSKDPGNEEAHRQLMSLHVSAGNRAAATVQYRRCQEYLKRQLQSDPSPETTAIFEACGKIGESTQPRPGLRKSRGSLPSSMTEIVGRSAERQFLTRALGRSRLVTICGPGGCGKTTMALDAGNAIAGEFDDGVWFSELAPLADPNLVVRCVSESLGLYTRQANAGIETVTSFIGKQRLLLILDNGEHVVEAVYDLTRRVMEACPNATILVTSREPLGLSSETIYRLPCLPYPDPAKVDEIEDMADFPSVRIFMANATRVLPDFGLSKQNAQHIARICAAVAGLPLALEMTGSLVEVLPLDEIVARTCDAVATLPTTVHRHHARHQNLAALVAWSYRLLTEDEQLLFRRLSVFRRGWTVAGATAICGDKISSRRAVDILIQLVRKSLVQPPVDGRYHILEPTRQFAATRLVEEGNQDLILRRHCDWYVQFVVAYSEGLYTEDQEASVAAIDSEYANIRKAIQYAMQHRLRDDVMRFGIGLYWYWFTCGKAFEGLGYLERAIGGIIPSSAIEARAMSAAAFLCWWTDAQSSGSQYAQAALRWVESENIGDIELRAFAYMAAALAESPPKSAEILAHVECYWAQSIELYRSIRHTWGITQGLLNSSVLHVHSNRPVQHRDYSLATKWLNEAYDLAHKSDNQIDIGKINYWLATTLLMQKADMAQVKARLMENLETHRSRRAVVDLAMSMNTLALILSSEDEQVEALELIRDSLDSLRRIDSTANTILTVQFASYVLAKMKFYDMALRLMAVAKRERGAKGSKTDTCDRWLSRVREFVDRETYDRAIAIGENLQLADAIELILHTRDVQI